MQNVKEYKVNLNTFEQYWNAYSGRKAHERRPVDAVFFNGVPYVVTDLHADPNIRYVEGHRLVHPSLYRPDPEVEREKRLFPYIFYYHGLEVIYDNRPMRLAEKVRFIWDGTRVEQLSLF